MATDDFIDSSAIPPYPEMILSAIEALDEKEGSSKSSISSYIESKYAEHLPEAHPALLAEYLQQMKESGEVAMVKNNYVKTDPSAPPKRGRGRPPKPKPELPPGAVLPPPRPRGRPPKDPLAAAVAKVAKGFGGKPRGRPPKKPRTAADGEDDSPSAEDAPEPAAAAVAAAAAAATPPSGVKRGRGRPPKVKPPFADVGFA